MGKQPDLLTGFVLAFSSEPLSESTMPMWWLLYLSLGVTEDDSLGDCERVIEIAQGVKLPFFPLHSHEKLLDSFKGQLITVGKNNSDTTLQTGERIQCS